MLKKIHYSRADQPFMWWWQLR